MAFPRIMVGDGRKSDQLGWREDGRRGRETGVEKMGGGGEGGGWRLRLGKKMVHSFFYFLFLIFVFLGVNERGVQSDSRVVS